RDPELAYTAGQWMTERPGGSDVSHTETTARPIGNSGLENGAPYELSGVKWFSSATDGQLALALAQIVGPAPAPTNPALLAPTPGDTTHSLGLGLFVVPLPGADLSLFTPDHKELVIQSRNGIGIHRLKNKIGTHALPTAELTLEGTVGFLLLPSPVNPKGQETGTGVVKPNGIRAIAPVLNITRIHSAATSIGSLARCLAIAEAYARVRRVAAPRVVGDEKARRGQVLLADVPLHTATLARVEIVRRALTHFLFGVVRLLGRVETGKHTEEEGRRLRLLTPVLKAFAAERAVGGMEECMAALGGLGYMEETGIGRLIRDSLVEKIWEGTTNVLALDMTRVAQEHSGTSVRALCEWASPIVAHDFEGRKADGHVVLANALKLVQRTFSSPRAMSDQTLARPALLLVANVTAAVYLLEHAAWSKQRIDAVVAARWIDEGGLTESVRDVERVIAADPDQTEWDKEIVHGKRRGGARL
ncbi:hypothetical protein FRC07_006876, partial [Ceratobasidium sp. 392]